MCAPSLRMTVDLARLMFLHTFATTFGSCDIISMPHLFQVSSSFIFQNIWAAWKAMAGLVHWSWEGSKASWNLSCHSIWSWRLQSQCVVDIPHFQARKLSRKDIFFWGELVGFHLALLKGLVYSWSGVRFDGLRSPVSYGVERVHFEGQVIQDECRDARYILEELEMELWAPSSAI